MGKLASAAAQRRRAQRAGAASGSAGSAGLACISGRARPGWDRPSSSARPAPPQLGSRRRRHPRQCCRLIGIVGLCANEASAMFVSEPHGALERPEGRQSGPLERWRALRVAYPELRRRSPPAGPVLRPPRCGLRPLSRRATHRGWGRPGPRRGASGLRVASVYTQCMRFYFKRGRLGPARVGSAGPAGPRSPTLRCVWRALALLCCAWRHTIYAPERRGGFFASNF